MANVILVTGGARCGKSSFAELLARQAELPVTYIATAQIRDEEMAVRVAQHKQSRPAGWRLIEEPLRINSSLLTLAEEKGVILIDCVTLWLTNLLLANWPGIEQDILNEVREVADVAGRIRPTVIFVSNEVGSGIVPDNPLARSYRDLAGRANQILAQAAEAVYLVVAGYPVEIKQRGQELLASLRRGGSK